MSVTWQVILTFPLQYNTRWRGFPGGSVVKNPPADAGDVRDSGWIPGSGRSSGGGNGNPLQYSCLENSLARGAWWATVYGVAKSQTHRSNSACKGYAFEFTLLFNFTVGTSWPTTCLEDHHCFQRKKVWGVLCAGSQSHFPVTELGTFHNMSC